ncbi:MAG: glycosyltransferase family A protein [Phycisphaeraceae bacterium]
MAPATVSVVLPVHNRPTVVIEALQSVSAQTHPPRCVVVVDDGSTDRTAEAVQQWLDGEGAALNAKLIRQENQGVAAARNHGAQAADATELLAFLDSDDIWPRDYLQRAAEALAAQPRAAAASADRLSIDKKSGEQHLDRRAWVEASDITARIFMHGPPGLSNSVYRRAAFDEVGGYDPAMRCGEEDYHMHLRVSLLGAWLHLPGEPVRYRQHTVDSPDPQQQLSRRCQDRRLRLARMMERFVEQEGGAQAMAGSAWRRRLGRVWHSAGRQLRKLERPDEAAACFERAVAWAPWHLRARLSRAMLSGAAERP